MSLHRSPVRALGGFQGNHCASPRVFGAKADNTTDDTAAIQATIDALKVLPGGGTVVIDGVYRITDLLNMDARVSFEGVGSSGGAGEGSAIMMDHATHQLFGWLNNGADVGTRQRIKNLLIGGKQNNNARIFDNTSGFSLDLVLDNVVFNETPQTGKLSGALWHPAPNSSRLTLRDCTLNQVSTSNSLVQTSNAGDDVMLVNSRFVAPDLAGSRMIDLSFGHMRVLGCDFFGGSLPGTCSFLHTGATAVTSAVGNHFRANTVNPGNWNVFTWAGGAVIDESGNVYEGTANPTQLTSPPKLGTGSRLSLYPHKAFTDTTTTVSLADYVENMTMSLSNASAPTLTMPNKLFNGQHFRCSIINTSGSSWTPVFSGVTLMGNTVGAIPSGAAATYSFVAADMLSLGNVQWCLVGVSHS